MCVSLFVSLLSYQNQTKENLQFWMRYLSEIFWRLSWNVFTISSEFFICRLVCQLAYFLTDIRLIWGYLQFWLRYLYEIFWRCFQDVSTLITNNSEFLVGLSVCQLAYFLTEMSQIQGYLQFWMRYLSIFFLTQLGYQYTSSKKY